MQKAPSYICHFALDTPLTCSNKTFTPCSNENKDKIVFFSGETAKKM